MGERSHRPQPVIGCLRPGLRGMDLVVLHRPSSFGVGAGARYHPRMADIDSLISSMPDPDAAEFFSLQVGGGRGVQADHDRYRPSNRPEHRPMPECCDDDD